MGDRLCQAQFRELQSGFEAERNPTLRVRLDRLARIREMLIDHESDLVAALMKDYGYRSPDQTSFAEITTTIKSVNHARKNLKFWMQREPRSTDISLGLSGARCSVEYAPKGVVGIVSPWNFPINLALSPAVSALAAGNRVFIKPSEATPETSELLAEISTRYFDSNELTVVCGGADVAKEFVGLPFDHLIYTGGTEVAKSIMASAAVNLTPLTLELGGKSPVVVDSTADLRLAARRVAFGKYFNAGQICIAPDYVLIQQALMGRFLEELETAVRHLSSSKTSSDYVDIINDKHRFRMKKMLASADRLGAEIRVFGDSQSGYALNVIIADQYSGEIEETEIFAPALLLRSVADIDEAIAQINQRSAPLVIYYFGRNELSYLKLRDATRSGALVQNDVIFQYANDDLPFGGVGDSGMGRYRGRDGFKEFSNHRAIYRGGRVDVSSLVTPPYPKLFPIINRLMRML